jgi:hypothetical protein
MSQQRVLAIRFISSYSTAILSCGVGAETHYYFTLRL